MGNLLSKVDLAWPAPLHGMAAGLLWAMAMLVATESPRPHCYLLSHLGGLPGAHAPWPLWHSHPLLLRLLSSEHSLPPSEGPMIFPASVEPKSRLETEPFGTGELEQMRASRERNAGCRISQGSGSFRKRLMENGLCPVLWLPPRPYLHICSSIWNWRRISSRVLNFSELTVSCKGKGMPGHTLCICMIIHPPFPPVHTSSTMRGILSAPPSPALSPGLVYTNPAYSILRMIDGIFKSKSDHTQFFLFYYYLLSFLESLYFSDMNNLFFVVYPNDSINFILFMCLTGTHEIKYSSPSKETKASGIQKGSD